LPGKIAQSTAPEADKKATKDKAEPALATAAEATAAESLVPAVSTSPAAKATAKKDAAPARETPPATKEVAKEAAGKTRAVKETVAEDPAGGKKTAAAKKEAAKGAAGGKTQAAAPKASIASKDASAGGKAGASNDPTGTKLKAATSGLFVFNMRHLNRFNLIFQYLFSSHAHGVSKYRARPVMFWPNASSVQRGS